MLKKTALSVFSLLTFAVFSLSNPLYAKNADSLQVKGSDTMVNLVQAWAEEYMKVHPELFVAVTGGGSGTGFAALINGTCDLAASSREIKKQEIELANKKGVSPSEHKVALDGLAVVVNPANPVAHLTLQQLADIFTGKITNWKDVGGTDAKIVLLSREVNSGTHVYFKEHVIRHNDSKSTEEFSSEALLLPSSQAIADEITHNTAAIGYYGMGYISPKQKALAISADEASPAQPPTLENVISGAYPISRPLYLYTNGESNEAAKHFLDYLLSPEGQSVVSKHDFVPLKQ